MEEYKRLKDSKDEDDKKLAKKMVPSRRYALACLIFKDPKGQEMDYNGEPRLLMVPSSVYQDIIEYWLDEDEAGDMTDPKPVTISKSNVQVQVNSIQLTQYELANLLRLRNHFSRQ